jgi:hypothetical protein
MNQHFANRKVRNYREDIMMVASWFQNDPAKFAKAIMTDATTFREFERLVGDLFSLAETIKEEA